MKLERCHNSQGAQYFRYDLDTKLIYHGSKHSERCIEADLQTFTVYEAQCDPSKDTQKFQWGFVNETSIRNWLNVGAKIHDSGEIAALNKTLT